MPSAPIDFAIAEDILLFILLVKFIFSRPYSCLKKIKFFAALGQVEMDKFDFLNN